MHDKVSEVVIRGETLAADLFIFPLQDYQMQVYTHPKRAMCHFQVQKCLLGINLSHQLNFYVT